LHYANVFYVQLHIEEDTDKHHNEEELRRIDQEARRLRSAEMSRQLEQEQRKLKEAEEAEEKIKAERELAQQRQLEKERIEQEKKEREEKETFVRQQNSVEEKERQRQKELLLAKMKAIDEGNLSSNQKTTATSANGDSKVDDFGLTFGDYKPSFITDVSTSSKSSKKTSDKKSELDDQHSNDIFHNAGYSSSGYSIHADHTSSVREGHGDQRDGYLLPRRNRQPILAVTRNADINVVSDLGEDIEEVTL